MMILKIAYFATAITLIILFYSMGKMCAKELLGDGSEFRFKKATPTEKFIAWLRMLIVAFCPIVNLLLLLTVVFLWEQVYEACLDKMEDRLEWK